MIPYKIAMIGCGKLGGPTAEMLADLGHDVRRFDVAFDTGYTHKQAVKDRNLILIAVPTPHDPRYDGSSPTSELESLDFSYADLVRAVTVSEKHAPKTPIVVISTVLPGTIRKLFGQMADRITYNPYLISMGMVKEDLANPDIIIMGTQDGQATRTTEMLDSIYAQMQCEWSNIRHRQLGTWEEAESTKIFYNTWISTKIGLSNMIMDVAQRVGNCDVDVIMDSLSKSTNRIVSKKYMTAGMGDGGPCHPRDNIALRWLAKEMDLGYDIFSAIMQAREAQAANLAKELIKQSTDYNLPIYIHGKSFKPDVPYCDGSYSLLIANYIQKFGHQYSFIDPLTETITPKSVQGVILLAHDQSVTYNYNKEQDAYCNFESGSVIVDPWRKYKTVDKSIKVVYYGNSRSIT